VYPEKIAKECEAPVMYKQKFMSNDLNASAIRANKFKTIHLDKRILLFCMFISVSTHDHGKKKKTLSIQDIS
jgi:hypothetical protein